MDNIDQVEAGLRQRLQPRQVPAADKAWRRLQPALHPSARKAGSRWRVARIGVGALTALLFTAGIALAGSPDLRQRLATMTGTGMSSANNHVTSLQPAPSFAVFQPAVLAPGMQLLTQGYQPGSTAADGERHLPTALGSYARQAGTTARPVLDQAAIDQANRLLSAGNEQTLVLVYGTPSGQLIGLVERAAVGKTLPPGEAIAVHRTPGTIAQQGTTSTLTWMEHGTWLEIQARLGRQQLLQFANGLQVSPLTSFANSEAAAALQARPSPVPLARRVAAAVTPVAAPAAAAKRCGPWDSKGYQSPSGTVFQQVRCVAQVVVGDAVAGDSAEGLSLDHWRHAAAQLALSPALGPQGDPTVWVVELGEGAHRPGWVVVLDAQTGHTDAQIALKPVP